MRKNNTREGVSTKGLMFLYPLFLLGKYQIDR